MHRAALLLCGRASTLSTQQWAVLAAVLRCCPFVVPAVHVVGAFVRSLPRRRLMASADVLLRRHERGRFGTAFVTVDAPCCLAWDRSPHGLGRAVAKRCSHSLPSFTLSLAAPIAARLDRARSAMFALNLANSAAVGLLGAAWAGLLGATIGRAACSALDAVTFPGASFDPVATTRRSLIPAASGERRPLPTVLPPGAMAIRMHRSGGWFTGSPPPYPAWRSLGPAVLTLLVHRTDQRAAGPSCSWRSPTVLVPLVYRAVLDGCVRLRYSRRLRRRHLVCAVRGVRRVAPENGAEHSLTHRRCCGSVRRSSWWVPSPTLVDGAMFVLVGPWAWRSPNSFPQSPGVQTLPDHQQGGGFGVVGRLQRLRPLGLACGRAARRRF